MAEPLESMDRKKRKFGSGVGDLSDSENHSVNDEIIFYEILTRLPLESLFECKLVCKEWQRVISGDPVFKASHCRRSVGHPRGVIYRVGDKYIFIDPSLKCKTLAVSDLRSSSNGLLCGACKRGGREYFYVTNPITKEVVYVPNLHNYKNVAFAYEELSCNPYFAIVARYDTASERLESGDLSTTVCFGVYSSQTGTWSSANAKVKVKKVYGEHTAASQARTLYMAEKVYWKLDCEVFWFHIKDDTGGSVSVPDYKTLCTQGVIGDCNGELSYTKVSSENVVIWVLVSNDTAQFEWVQKYSVSFTLIFKDYYTNFKSSCEDTVSELLLLDTTTRRRSTKLKRYFNAFARPMPFEGEDVQFWARYGVSKNEGVVFSYNMKTRALQIVHNTQIDRYGDCFFSYRRSLASVPK